MAETRTEWTVDDVAARFAEAAETAHKLPRVRPGGYYNPWMTLAVQVPERYPDLERLYRPMPPSPKAVERMLETMRWVQWLEVEQRHLVWMRANRYEWQQIGRRFACDRNTAARRWRRLMELVAWRLNTLSADDTLGHA
ncbi:MAG: helix-turn-helix domain-containing protein [Betaproteobacteria bacterium]|nr:helix-turn-helix domain-containing protein [Betaproteobacteria bacterium]